MMRTVLSACFSHAAIAGNDATSPGFSRLEIAPQCEWPQMMTSRTPRLATANSMVAASPPAPAPCGGTRLPAFRRMNSSPGSVCVMRFGTTRESEHVIISVSGC